MGPEGWAGGGWGEEGVRWGWVAASMLAAAMAAGEGLAEVAVGYAWVPASTGGGEGGRDGGGCMGVWACGCSAWAECGCGGVMGEGGRRQREDEWAVGGERGWRRGLGDDGVGGAVGQERHHGRVRSACVGSASMRVMAVLMHG